MGMCPPPAASGRRSSFPSPSRQVESSDTPKDIAAVPKCPVPCPEASPAEPLPNGDVEGDGAQWKGAEEGGASPKGGRPEEDETESLPDGETGQALENGRCTPKEGLDAPADEGELAPSDPQKKRGRRKLLEATEKSKTLALRAPRYRAAALPVVPPAPAAPLRGPAAPTALPGMPSPGGARAAAAPGAGGGRAEPLRATRDLGWGQQMGRWGAALAGSSRHTPRPTGLRAPRQGQGGGGGGRSSSCRHSWCRCPAAQASPCLHASLHRSVPTATGARAAWHGSPARAGGEREARAQHGPGATLPRC